MQDINNLVYSLDTYPDFQEETTWAQSLTHDIPKIGYQGMDAIPMSPLDGKYTRDGNGNPFGARGRATKD
ncbi:hypothetical protein EZS27_022277 [termite gut metagenome]|uniref:Uncharacterized protein n=1 Tax=termite gut metagenome TaxID=433724 RepID=A0A5J4R6I2_9ZZZZ